MRSALAPSWSNRWYLLQLLLAPSVELSAAKGTACRRAATPMPRYSGCAGRSCEPVTLRWREQAANTARLANRWRCRMSAALVLPFVWALAAERPVPQPRPAHYRKKPRPQVAFYRKYTEAMLRRYVRMS